MITDARYVYRVETHTEGDIPKLSLCVCMMTTFAYIVYVPRDVHLGIETNLKIVSYSAVMSPARAPDEMTKETCRMHFLHTAFIS